MNSLNSVVDTRRAVAMTGVGLLITFLLFAPLFASATSYQLSVTTDKAVYNPGATITISGAVTPAPPSGTYVTISITSPLKALADHLSAPVGSDGTYSGTSVASGTNWAVGGIYTVTAVWAANVTGPAYTQITSFKLNVTTPTTSVPGITTTVFYNVTTTVVQQTTTTVAQQTTTTVAQQTTTTVAQQTTVTAQTTVTQQATTTVVAQTTTTVNAQTTTTQVNNFSTTVTDTAAANTALVVGIVGVVIAIIAGVIAFMALRRK
jgi:hypothetical protein